MFNIVRKEMLSSNIVLFDVEAPLVAKNALPGQFLIVRADERGERIPLTICDNDPDKGTVTLVIQTVGAETQRMADKLDEGGCFADIAGPLGNPSELTELDDEELKNKKILFIAGGLGTAPVYAQLKWLADKGVKADCIQGARTKDILILVDEMKAVCGNLYLATDDGSEGIHGNVTVALQQLWDEGKRYDLCIVIGPMIMMKFACVLTKKLGIRTIVSMNTIMVDGTGMCGACRLLVDGKVRFACVDGPEFDGHLVDFDSALQRARLYATQEGRLLLKYKEGETHHGGCGVCSD
ncbi:MAG: sulfide/dihydroorotate dehydrogenase-like FAD/NAD-binding protein [Lachnospiraceae bacterium]|nr:sulfide/dihydroorotate dehydrogenase-like FAD/NAD-binding protein [Lachnospiraceae bacterium]